MGAFRTGDSVFPDFTNPDAIGSNDLDSANVLNLRTRIREQVG